MKRALIVAVLLALLAPLHARAQLPSFRSQPELMRWLRQALERQHRASRVMSDASAMGAAQGAPQPMAAARAGTEAITNVQTAGVDEGDIVKLHGDYLVILRRGRLFTVSIGGGTLRPATTNDAFGRGIDPSGTWYDEMLIADGRVVVIGYSYARGGTEAGIFRLDTDGSLHHLSTFQLRSNDYYSSRNYAARLIGTKLVFYAPLYLWSAEDLESSLPAYRRWNRQQGDSGFVPIVRPERTFRPAEWEPGASIALHTVTSCELASADVTCEATVVVGPPGNVFYVSQAAVYVWMTEWNGQRRNNFLARLPLDGGRPTAQKVSGSPVDQFSFLESEGYINVLTVRGANGDQMWDGEQTGGPVSLLRMAIDSMGDGRRAAPSWWYRPLPPVRAGTFQNRFAGDYLLYGTGSGWGSEEPSARMLYAVAYRGGDPMAIRLAHGVDRIEVMGPDAVVIGVRGSDLHFSGIRLRGQPRVAQRYVMHDASQGEMRSHGFFYRPDGADSGVLGLPVRGAEQQGWRHLVEGSASVLFLRNVDGRFVAAGRLAAGATSSNDNCRASCVDWYGNARPIFARGRTFALLGYELVEGTMRDGVMRESRRVSFMPEAPRLARY